MTAPRPTVALIFGGASSEHEISCLTAGGVLRAIDGCEDIANTIEAIILKNT